MSKKIALFVGHDITAHLILNEVVKSLVERYGYEPILYFPKHPTSAKASLPELQEYSFLERELLNNNVYPFIEALPFAGANNLSPNQLAEKYDLQIQQVADVNDPAFIQSIADDKEIQHAISIRCFQIFKPEIINTINEHGLFLNLHPGLLPEYRGVMSTLRRAFDIATGKDKSEDYGCTLHKIDQGIDTGKIVDMSSITLDKSQSAFMATLNLAPTATKLILAAVEKINAGETLRGYPQENENCKYYTYPTQDELSDIKKANIKLIDKEEVIRTIVDRFSKAGSTHGTSLSDTLTKAIGSFDDLKDKRIIANDLMAPAAPLSAYPN